MAGVLESLREEEPKLKTVDDTTLATFLRDEYPDLIKGDKGVAEILEKFDAGAGIRPKAEVQQSPITPPQERLTTAGGPPKSLNPHGLGAYEYFLEPLMGDSDKSVDESVIGIDPTDIPSGQQIKQTLGVPKGIGVPAAAISRTAAGLGQFATSPKGMAQITTAAIPGIGLLQRASWALDMAKGAGETAGSLSVTLEKIASNPKSATDDDIQKAADETAMAIAQLYGAGKLTSLDVAKITGVRAPLGRLTEGKQKRLAKDLAWKLKKADLIDPANLPVVKSEAAQRAWANVKPEPGRITKITSALKDFFSRQGQFEEFANLEKLSEHAEVKLGRKLKPAESPYTIAAARRGTAGAIADYMVREKMTDLSGNPIGPGLLEILEPVKGRRDEMFLKLWADQAIDLHKAGKNPGMALEDATWLSDKLSADPALQKAAKDYKQFQRGVLEYWREADPGMSPAIDAMLKANPNYVPLARALDPSKYKKWATESSSNPLQRRHGSELPIRDIFEQTAKNTQRIIQHAHRQQVLQALAKLSKVEGMEQAVREVPKSHVKNSVNIDKVRRELEEMGVDTSLVPEETMLSWWSTSQKPRSMDPIVSIKDAAGTSRWYEVNPEVLAELEGLQVYRMGPLADMMLGIPSRTFRLGTTGLRPAFSLVTNPTRDMQTWIMQTQTSANPARLAAEYLNASKEIIAEKAGGKASPGADVFYRSGAQLGQPLGQDINYTRKITKELWHGKVARVVTDPVTHTRELLGIPEGVARVAEINALAKQKGIDLNGKLTGDQFLELALAAKRATVDFSQTGRYSKVFNQMIPFFNPALQGIQSFARAFAARPARTVAWGLTALTVPALANWYRNKDKDWYVALPPREKFLYTNVEVGDEILRVPRAFEWGNLFMTIPEAIFDSWYRQDPQTAAEAAKHVLETTAPDVYPVPLKMAAEQWQNRVAFFDRPIVPRSEIDLPPGEQKGPYTSKLAEWLGTIAPEHISPRRVDIAVRSYFGGVAPDLLGAIGLGSKKSDRDFEPSDIPVLGTLFRRGGKFSAQNRHINDFWDEFISLDAKISANNRRERMDKEQGLPLSGPVFDISAQELDWHANASVLKKEISEGQKLAAQLPDRERRSRLYHLMGQESKLAVDYLKKTVRSDPGLPALTPQE